MLLPWKFGRKCCFCNKKKNLLFIPTHGIYGELYLKYAYHAQCLEIVSTDPEKYGHKKVDLALEIIEQIKHHVEKLDRIKDNRKQKIQLLQEYSSKIPWWELEKFKP